MWVLAGCGRFPCGLWRGLLADLNTVSTQPRDSLLLGCLGAMLVCCMAKGAPGMAPQSIQEGRLKSRTGVKQREPG